MASAASVALWSVFLLLTWRWWWTLAAELWRDVNAAASFPADPGSTARIRRSRQPPFIDPRTHPGRVLAFQGVEPRVRARRRWEGGFGRRGL